MGFISLPVSAFLYWLMLRSKKEIPFPKSGFFLLLIAGAISVGVSVVLNLPLAGIVSFFRLGILSDLDRWTLAIKENPAAISEMVQNAVKNTPPTFFGKLIDMFFAAGLLEEGLKFLTCRLVIRREGMIRTWMDSVAAFAIVGITFEFLENIAFGMDSDFLSALMRAVASAHFVFGVIMGYYYGKYLVKRQKKYLWLSFWIPVIYHTVTNALIASAPLNRALDVLGTATAISHIVAVVLTVILVFRWQKKRMLDIQIQNDNIIQTEGEYNGQPKG